MLTYRFNEIDQVDYAFSLGTLWDDGDGIIGLDLTKSKRLEKIRSNNLYSG